MVDFQGVKNALLSFTDNFDRQVSNPIDDIIIVDGEKDFTPERLRYFKDGTRRFLEYGSDANFSEVDSGHLLSPDAGQTLTLKTAERSFYPVGNDLWPSMARRLTQAPQAGDAVGGGYGVIDLANFDPANVSYSGTTADGFFWYHTQSTGLDSVLLALVQGGTIVNSGTFSLPTAADILTIVAKRLNYYDVGPAVTRLTSTDIANFPEDPQRNEFVGAVANDDGKGPERGSHRATLAIHQAAGNTGLEAELGSLAIKTPGPAEPNFKTKSHRMSLTTTTTGTWEAVGAIRGENARPTVKVRIPEIDIVSTPDTSVTDTRVVIQSTAPTNTDADDAFPAAHADAVPPEHSGSNSVIEEVEDNTISGPDEAASGTDITGATSTQTTTNPGGYQLGYDAVTTEGTGSKTMAFQGGRVGNRELYDTDIGLIWGETATAGTFEVDVVTQQNS